MQTSVKLECSGIFAPVGANH